MVNIVEGRGYSMKKLMVCIVALVAMFGAAVRAQQTENPAETGSPAQTTPKSGAQILSDTMGVDFSGYIRRLHADIERNWEPLIPAEANRPELKKGIVGIRITILPDGKIGSMKLETPSGDVAFDKAAWGAITSEGQFPALPQAFHGPLLDLRLGFFYNSPPPAK
jgi:TonB family protein